VSTMTLSIADDDGTTIDYSFQPETWYHALDHFVKFLRAQGYRIEDDSVLINSANRHWASEDQIYILTNVSFTGKHPIF
jgi:hypothetical protein